MVKTKHPTGAVDYTLDWASVLGADAISTSAWTATGGCSVLTDSNTTDSTTVVLAGGESKATCIATNTITTVAGLTHVGEMAVRIL